MLVQSDFHPESWNPMWSVSTILTGLYSFMIENSVTLGSIETTTHQKRKFARQSLDFNVRDTNFCKLFPEYVELQKERAEMRRLLAGDAAAGAGGVTQEPSTAVMPGENGVHGVFAYAAGIVALLSIVFAMLRFI
jgi:ubiquitin-conjugating enzyme E2 J2